MSIIELNFRVRVDELANYFTACTKQGITVSFIAYTMLGSDWLWGIAMNAGSLWENYFDSLTLPPPYNFYLDPKFAVWNLLAWCVTVQASDVCWPWYFTVYLNQNLSTRCSHDKRRQLILHVTVIRYFTLDSLTPGVICCSLSDYYWMQNVAVFAFESEELGKDGQRRYVATTYYEFGKRYLWESSESEVG